MIWLRDPGQGTHKTKSSTDLGRYFLGVAQIQFRKNKQSQKMSELPLAKRSPIINNMTDVDVFM